MLDFSLDIIQEFAEAIVSYEPTNNKSQYIRAFIIFYDSIREVELKAEELLISFDKYKNYADCDFDLSVVRSLIRDFAFVIYKLVDNFRKYGFITFGAPLEIFETQLAEILVAVGTIKSIFCRSLLEIAIPHICVDRKLPAIEQRYFLRILDYEHLKYSSEKVKITWKNVLVYLGMRDLLGRVGNFPLVSLQSFTEKEHWINSVSIYNYYQHGVLAIRDPYEVQLNESFICSIHGFKIVSFTDIKELEKQLCRSQISLDNLRDRRIILKEFLSTNFSISDFF